MCVELNMSLFQIYNCYPEQFKIIQELESLTLETPSTKRNSIWPRPWVVCLIFAYSKIKHFYKQFSVTNWLPGNSVSEMCSFCPTKPSKSNSHKKNFMGGRGTCTSREGRSRQKQAGARQAQHLRGQKRGRSEREAGNEANEISKDKILSGLFSGPWGFWNQSQGSIPISNLNLR